MTKYLVAALAATALLSGCAAVSPGLDAVVNRSTVIEDAAEKCDVNSLVRDDGNSISFDTPGEDADSGTDTLDGLVCVMVALDMPDSVVEHVESTRAVDGQQTDSWGDVSARWTYHPDEGTNMTVTMKN